MDHTSGNTEIDFFAQNYRRISSRIDLNFYANISESEVKRAVNWSEQYRQRNVRFQGLIERLNDPSNTVKRKYATLDGHTFLSEIKTETNQDIYLIDTNQPLLDFPIWSEQQSGIEKSETEAYRFDSPPLYSLDFGMFSRKINQFYVVGDERWEQYPCDFDIILTLAPNAIEANFDSWDDDLKDYNERLIEEKDILRNNDTVTIQVRGNTFVRCLLLLPAAFDAVKVELKLLSWNAPHTNGKILFFSNDLSISFQSDDISSISVLEEKTGSVEDLDYGITSNTCTVQISNNNERFIRYRDLLKQNRVLQPYITCGKRTNDEIVNQTHSLGKFYTDSWQISETSNFITCKAYDILYALQNMRLYYTMEPESNAAGATYPYVLDGAASGKNGNAYQVFKKIFRLINREKRDNGIYGSDIVDHVDQRLMGVPMRYVLLGADTAWNMLQQMAALSLSNVYVDRDGAVCVVRDRLAGETPTPDFDTWCGAGITPDNSFTYNLPAMSRTVVNRVTVPYVSLKSEDYIKEEILVKKKDFLINRDSLGVPQAILISASFDWHFNRIDSVIYYLNEESLESTPQNLRLSSNGLTFQLPYSDALDKVRIKITADNIIKTENFEVTEENFLSQTQNGVKGFRCECGDLITDAEMAKAVAKKIVDTYAFGKTFIETEWIGTPQMKLGTGFTSYTRKDGKRETYECLSNEITMTGGLRFKTKARQK